jgi:hypothetical protein
MKTSIRSLSQLLVILVVIALCGSAAPLLSRQAQSGSHLKGIPVLLPLSFEANQGQSDSRVRYLARGPGYTVFLTKEEAVLALKPGADRSRSRGGEASHQPSQGAVVRIQPVGINPGAGIQPLERLPGTSNYFIGADPARWRTGIPTYAKVKYEGIHPGIDLVYYGNQRQLECDFIVAPGADPSTIGLAFQGIEGLELGSQGDLVLKVKDGEVRMHKPVVYQVVGDRRQELPGEYVLRDNNQVGFVVATYDTSKPLVIDPVLSFSTYLGGSSVDVGNSIYVDGAGQAYVTGSTQSSGTPAGFPTTSGAFQTDNAGSTDAFVTKLNDTGTALVYSTYLGGSSNDVGNGIYVDGFGNAYVTGSTTSSDFPTSSGAFQTSYGGGGDAFVTKLNPAGTGVSDRLYSTYLGGSSADIGNSIFVDGFGNAYVTGSTTSSDFPTSSGAFQTSYGGGGDAFVTKLNPAGTGVSDRLYSTYLGGSSADIGNSIFVDGFGNAYVTGSTQSSGTPAGFPTTLGAFQTDNAGSTDAFVTKLNPAGTGVSDLVYSTYLGGSSADVGNGIYVDGAGQAYVTGSTQSSGLAPAGFPTTSGAFQTSYGGGGDAFVTKLNAAGMGLVDSSYLGGAGEDVGKGIFVDGAGNAYVTGSTTSDPFPTTAGALQTTFGGTEDAFVAKIGPSGSSGGGTEASAGGGGGGGCFIATASAFEARK